MPRYARIGITALAVLAGITLLITFAWAIDARAHNGQVLRNVELAGEPIGGLTRAEVEGRVALLADGYRDASVEVKAPGGGFTTTTPSIGMELAVPSTVRAAMNARRSGSLFSRAWNWVAGFVADTDVSLQVVVDRAKVYEVVEAQDPGPRTPPVEPTVAFRDGAFVAVPGEPGSGIDPRDVLDALPDAAGDGLPIVVEVDRGEVAPRFPLAAARRLAGRAQARVNGPIDVRAGDTRATVPLETLRNWVGTHVTPSGLELTVVPERAVEDLRNLLPGAGEPPVETRFTVDGGVVRIIPGRTGTGCCDPASATRIAQTLFGPGDPPVPLVLDERAPKLTVERARELGVKEPVSSFTTEHRAGEARVQNIHRIADMIRGQVILPGETFSVNGFVGRRTREKGFVSAGVIVDGKFTEDVGGGISQFATTLFNAAFFAGLEFEAYQSHSIYISRYPYGREATLSYPRPDLEIRNNTPYGIVIWPSYTARSITVTLYSTKYVNADETGQTKSRSGRCTRVKTERTRVYLDGRREVDHVFALYRPGEGINC